MRSITPPILQDDIRKNPITEHRLASRFKIRQIRGLFLICLGDDTRDHLFAFPQFDGLPGTQPGLETASVAELSNID